MTLLQRVQDKHLVYDQHLLEIHYHLEDLDNQGRRRKLRLKGLLETVDAPQLDVLPQPYLTVSWTSRKISRSLLNGCTRLTAEGKALRPSVGCDLLLGRFEAEGKHPSCIPPKGSNGLPIGRDLHIPRPLGPNLATSSSIVPSSTGSS